jgi:magnesium chelatase subunit I
MSSLNTIFPFLAIEGQEKMKLALILNIINPGLSGVLIRGEKGTAKSTAVRALADILPAVERIKDCPFMLINPGETETNMCSECHRKKCSEMVTNKKSLATEKVKMKVVELPVGATEDRVVGTLDIEHALKDGKKQIEPGLLAEAHRGILYVDEVNLLDDHVIDVLLDSAAMGINTIEREGISFIHPSKFTLVGTMNPEEGELRPQLLDRFGLCVNIKGISNPDMRVKIMERRVDFDLDAKDFSSKYEESSKELAKKIIDARKLYSSVSIEKDLLFEIAKICVDVGVDGHRGDIIILKTSKTIAAWNNRDYVVKGDIEEAAGLSLPHRIRRQPLQEISDNFSVQL